MFLEWRPPWRQGADLLGELHAARSRGTPTLPTLGFRLPIEKMNLSGEATMCRPDIYNIRWGCSARNPEFRGSADAGSWQIADRYTMAS